MTTEQPTPMAPSYTKDQIQQLLLEFEAMVRALLTKFSEEDVIKLIALISQNHIQNGKFTEEYIQLSKMALQMRKTQGEELNTAQSIILDGFAPRQKKL